MVPTLLASLTSRKEGFGWSGHHIQVLRNHRVGSTCKVAASGPRFATLIWIKMSVGEAFAYSTNTSKYRRHRICRCRAIHIQDPDDCDLCWYLLDPHKGIRSEDIYINTSCMNGLACCRGR